jgi:hypothetical protein
MRDITLTAILVKSLWELLAGSEFPIHNAARKNDRNSPELQSPKVKVAGISIAISYSKTGSRNGRGLMLASRAPLASLSGELDRFSMHFWAIDANDWCSKGDLYDAGFFQPWSTFSAIFTHCQFSHTFFQEAAADLQYCHGSCDWVLVCP